MRFPVGHGSYAPRLAVVGNFLGLVGLLFTGLQLWKMHSSSHRLVMRQGKPHRVVVWDFSGPAHDEVILPLMWTLQNLAIPADLYRDTFRPGSREALTAYFTGEIYTYDSLVKQDMTTIDIIILANGDRDTINLLQSGLLDKHPHLRVLAIAHQLPQWDIENADRRALTTKLSEQRFPTGQQLVKVAEYVQEKRWQFVVLSPHMAAGLVRIYSMYPALRSLVDSLAGSVHLFIPVMPVPRAKHKLASDAQSFKACIVGQISRSRDYDRIIKTLYRAQKAKPRNWRAPQLMENGQVGSSGPTFLLSILGTVRGRKYYRIPRTLKGMIRESTGIVSFAEFYAELSTADILLPAFTNNERYISEVSSGAIPAAVMARVPVLLDADQLSAYSYLENPAYILQQEGENEIQAIARLRKTPSGPIAQANETAAWEQYEQKLYERNRQAMLGALGLSAANVTESS